MTGKKSRESGAGSLNVYRDLGQNAPSVFADAHYKGTIPSLKQIIFNSWDEDATCIDLVLDLARNGSGYFSLTDNGAGMLPQEVGNFTRLGSSSKIEDSYTPGGRKRYGRMGLGTILITKLCERWKLTTEKGGYRSVMEEDFSEGPLTSDHPLPVNYSTIPEDRHGTIIEMYDLTFDAGFSLENLERRLRWEMPVLPDFAITINGVPITSKVIENAKEYVVDETGEHVGKVSGSIYFTTRKTNDAGIHVYVNGRSIGDPGEVLKRLCSKSGMQDRIVGIVNADGLDNAIMLGTETFIEGDRGVMELEEVLRRELLNVRADYEVSSSSPRKFGERRAKSAAKIGAKLGGSNGLEALGKKGVKFVEGDSSDASWDVRVDETGSYLLNPYHPSFVLMSRFGRTSLQHVESSILHALVDEIATQKMTPDLRSVVESYFGLRNEVWAQIASEAGVSNSQRRLQINPSRVYSSAELSELSEMDISPRSIRDLASLGVIVPHEEDKIVGKNFLDFKRKYNGLVTLYDFIHGDDGIPIEKQTHLVQRAARLFGRLGDAGQPFVYNILKGKPGTPYYLLEESSLQLVAENFLDKDFRSAENTPESVFKPVADMEYPMYDLIGFFKDGNIVPEVLRSMPDDESVSIRHGSDGGILLADFIRLYQLYRGLDWVVKEPFFQVPKMVNNARAR